MHGRRNELAIIIGGQILAHPVIIRTVTTGWVQITGFPARAEAGFALRSVLAG